MKTATEGWQMKGSGRWRSSIGVDKIQSDHLTIRFKRQSTATAKVATRLSHSKLADKGHGKV